LVIRHGPHGYAIQHLGNIAWCSLVIGTLEAR
jgi:hypothetical protein